MGDHDPTVFLIPFNEALHNFKFNEQSSDYFHEPSSGFLFLL